MIGNKLTTIFAACLAVSPLVAADIAPLPLAETVSIRGVEIHTKQPPKNLATRDKLGLITAGALNGQVVHRTTSRVLETRATITPGGDYLLMFAEGDYYAKSRARK